MDRQKRRGLFRQESPARDQLAPSRVPLVVASGVPRLTSPCMATDHQLPPARRSHGALASQKVRRHQDYKEMRPPTQEAASAPKQIGATESRDSRQKPE